MKLPENKTSISIIRTYDMFLCVLAGFGRANFDVTLGKFSLNFGVEKVDCIACSLFRNVNISTAVV